MTTPYYLFVWTTPHVRTNAAARNAFFAKEKEVGSAANVQRLASGLASLGLPAVSFEEINGALMFSVPDDDLAGIADPLRTLVAELGFVLFDLQSERLVVPPASASPWPPVWTDEVATVREIAGDLPVGIDQTAYREVFVGAVHRWRGAQPPPPPTTVPLPFEATSALPVPFLVPDRLRTAKRLNALAGRLNSRIVTSRRAAATLLGGWCGHEGAIDLLRARLATEADIYARALCALGLALSDAISPEFLVSEAEEMTRSAKNDVDFEGVFTAIFAAIIAIRRRKQPNLDTRLRQLAGKTRHDTRSDWRWTALWALIPEDLPGATKIG